MNFTATTGASATINPLVQYSLAGATFQTVANFSDSTSGFQSTGSVSVKGPALTTLASNPWAQATINATTKYWVRIQRQVASLGTTPNASSIGINTGSNGGNSAAANSGAGGGGGYIAPNGTGTLHGSGGDGGSGYVSIEYA